MINGSWQRRLTTESTERYCFLCALCGYKPFQEIIKSLVYPANKTGRINTIHILETEWGNVFMIGEMND